MTPSEGEAPMTQPPRKCAVIGIPNISPQVPRGVPANRRPPTGVRPRGRRAASFGFGCPCPWRLDELGAAEAEPRFADIVSELSWACITSAITVRSDHARRSSARRKAPRLPGHGRNEPPARLGPVAPVPPLGSPSTMMVPKRPIMLEP